MMKKLCFAKLILIACGLFTGASNSFGQNVYCFTDVVYDKATKSFLGISRTSLEYTAALYYDPAVVGTLYDEKQRISSDTFSMTTTDYTATALTRSGSPATENTLFGLYSDHFVIGYLKLPSKTYVTDAEISSSNNAPQKKITWYDPLGLSRFGSAQDLGWHIYRGGKLGTVVDSRSYLLGTTKRGAFIKPAGK